MRWTMRRKILLQTGRSRRAYCAVRSRETKSNRKRKKLRQLFKLNAAPTAALGALTFVAIAAPTSAHAGAYYRRDYSYSLQRDQLHCGFDTMAQCQVMNSGRDGDCLRDPFQDRV